MDLAYTKRVYICHVKLQSELLIMLLLHSLLYPGLSIRCLKLL